jgi:hypothetical protein
MLAIEHRGQHLWYDEPGAPAVVLDLPADLFAVGLGPRQSSAFDASGGVWTIDPAGLRRQRRQPLPGEARRAAISADGELIVVALAGSSGIHVARGGAWTRAREPDSLQEVTDLRCGRDGASFGYAWLGGLPVSDFGSYGERQAGGVVIGADGGPLREILEDRRHDDLRARRVLAWGRGADPLVFSRASERPGEPGMTEVHAGGRPDREAHVFTWAVGAPRRKGVRVFDVHFLEAVCAVVSPEGERVGLLDGEGTAWLVDLPGARWCKVAEGAIAIELLDPALPGVVTAERRWVRAPVPDGAWERAQWVDE